MPPRGRTDFNAEDLSGWPRPGYGPLAAAWLLLLGGGALVGWVIHSSPPPEQPVRTAPLYTDELPAPPAARVLAEAIDPRVHQLAARGTPTRAATQRASAEPATTEAAAPAPDTPVPAPSSARSGDTAATSERAATATPQVQLAARTDGGAPDEPIAGEPGGAAQPASGPLPPPVPRSVIGPVTRAAARDAAGRYSVQVGAFRQRQNAVARAAQLSEAGYDVRIVHAFATRSRLFMVRLGSFDARPAAIAYARRLARDVEMETWPVRN